MIVPNPVCNSRVGSATVMMRACMLVIAITALKLLEAQQPAAPRETADGHEMDIGGLKSWMRARGADLSDERLAHLFRVLDRDRNGYVSPKEAALVEATFGVSAKLVCHSNYTAVRQVFPGCPCLPREGTAFGACPAGYQCAVQWQGDIWPALSINSTVLRSGALCMPCALGQHCPRGSFQPAPGPGASAYVLSHLCRPGMQCPMPNVTMQCPAGTFCGRGAVGPTTCSYVDLLETDPWTVVPTLQRTVREHVYLMGDPMAGNYCPSGSETLDTPCDAGYYCPNSSTKILCPAGKFCKYSSRQPRNCPWLAHCKPGAASADLSLGGFLALFIILGLLFLSYAALAAYIRLQQERLVKKQAAQDKLQQLVAPLLSLHDPYTLAFNAFGAIRPRITLRFEELGVQLRDGLTILDGVTGRFSHSTVTAVMGPSGAGKSTLLYCLMGTSTYGRTTGRLWVNGREMRLSRLRRVMGYVPQDDVLHEDLTVRENLAYSAWLRSEKGMKTAAKGQVVDDVIDLLRLRHVQHSLVGSVEKRGISGGQRKRVNIGLELVAKPSLLFMDEPTSGLDATAATDILGALRRMAELGMTIVVVIHQPRFRVFSLFHEVLLLGKAGRTVFLGPGTRALPYFQSLGFQLPPNENPADWFLDIISGIVPCPADPDFKPEDLYTAWEREGVAWMGSNEGELASSGSPQNTPRGEQVPPPDLSPEQLQLVMQHFDRVVEEEGMEQLTPAAIRAFLLEMGLEPSAFEVDHIIKTVDTTGSGTISRDDFLGFIRRGGRPASSPLASQTPAPRWGQGLLPGRSHSSRTTAPPPASLPRAPALAPEGSRGAGGDPTGEGSAGASLAEGSEGGYSSAGPDERGEEAAPGLPGARSQEDGMTGPSLLLYDEEWAGPRGEGGLTKQEQEAGAAALSNYLEGGPPSDIVPRRTACSPCCSSWGAWLHTHGTTVYWLLFGWEWGTGVRYRRVPGASKQFRLLLRRAGVKWVRGWGLKFVDLLLFIGSAIVIGAVHGTAWDLETVRGNAVMAMLLLGCISVISSLQVFGKDRLIFWRESASGLSTGAYFCGHATLHLVDVIVQPAIFLSVYYTLTLPEIHFVDYYVVAVLVVWYTSGLAYLCSVLMAHQNAQIAAVSATVVCGGFLNGVQPRYRDLSKTMRIITGFSYSLWSTEAITIEEFKNYPHYMQPRIKMRTMWWVGYCGLNHELGSTEIENVDINTYCAGYVERAYIILFAMGLVMRVLTYLCLQYFCAQPNMGNPLHRIFTYFWSHVLDKSRRIRSLANPKPAGFSAPRNARSRDEERTTPLLGDTQES